MQREDKLHDSKPLSYGSCGAGGTTAVWYLPWSLHPLPEAEVNYGEDEKKAEHQLPANTPDVSQPRRLVDLKNIPPVRRKHINHLAFNMKRKMKISRRQYLPSVLLWSYFYTCGLCYSHLHALTCKIPLPETWSYWSKWRCPCQNSWCSQGYSTHCRSLSMARCWRKRSRSRRGPRRWWCCSRRTRTGRWYKWHILFLKTNQRNHWHAVKNLEEIRSVWMNEPVSSSPSCSRCINTWLFDTENHNVAVSRTFENGADVFPYGYRAGSVELPQCQLHVEERHTTEDGHQNVGDKKSSCTDMHQGKGGWLFSWGWLFCERHKDQRRRLLAGEWGMRRTWICDGGMKQWCVTGFGWTCVRSAAVQIVTDAEKAQILMWWHHESEHPV